jgi:hypothetical protein
MDSDDHAETTNKNSIRQTSYMGNDAGAVLQPVRVRYRPVLADSSYWQFVESELRFVLYNGAFFYIIHLLSLALQ